jgi:hypothetical protein
MRELAQFSDYEGMLDAIRARVQELEINGEAFDEFAGLPEGYLSKLICANPIRRIGMLSMGPLFTALGVTLVMIEDPETTERLKMRLKPRNKSFVRSAPRIVFTKRFLKQIGNRGRTNRWQKLSKKQRSSLMRALARRRWSSRDY